MTLRRRATYGERTATLPQRPGGQAGPLRLLLRLALAGRPVSMDAPLTYEPLAEALAAAGMDYMLP